MQNENWAHYMKLFYYEPGPYVVHKHALTVCAEAWALNSQDSASVSVNR